MTSLIIQVLDPERGTNEYTFDRSPVRIGRSALNDLPLAFPTVSHCHGVLHFDKGRCQYVDLGSTNGSAVNGRPVTRNLPSQVDSDATLSLGSVQLRLRFQNDGARATRHSYAFDRRALLAEAGLRPQTESVPDGARARAAISTPDPQPPQRARLATSGGDPQPRVRAATGVADPQPRAAVVPSIAELDPELVQACNNYRQAWSSVLERLERRVGRASPAERERLLGALIARFPELAQESGFRRLFGTDASSPVRTESGSRPARKLDPYAADASFRSRADSRASTRSAALIDRFVRTFIELRRGREQLLKQLGLGQALESSEISERAHDPAKLMDYLLDPAQGETPFDALARAYADVMLHDVAFLSAVTAGARELVQSFEPASLALQAGGWLGGIQRLFGIDPRWNAVKSRFADLQEESALSATLFGRAFQRAYFAVIGAESSGRSDTDKKA